MKTSTLGKKPNILFIQADQMASFVLPIYNPNGQAIIPNLTALADDGVVFTNAYCNSPLCAPSRACMMSGTRTSHNEVWGNGSEFHSDIPTLMHHLRGAGYRTVVTGKTHFIGADQLHGFDKRLTTDIYPADFSWSIDWKPKVEHRPGTSVKKLQVSGLCRTNNQILYDSEVQFRAIEYLRCEALEPKDTPFMLHISYTQPHESYQTTPKFWNLYDGVEIASPAQKADPEEELHPINRWLRTHHGIDAYPPSDAATKLSRRAYYGMISQIDEYIGEIVDELKLLGLYENTIIVFTSDHGDMMGERGMWFKRTFFEHSVKVPLLVHYPVAFPSRREDMIVSLADLCPTLAEIASDENEPGRFLNPDSSSFRKMLSGKMENWKDEAIMEYFGPGVEEPWLAIRSNKWKYVFTRNNECLFYDLQEDPLETRNLICEKQYKDIINDLHARLMDGIDLEAVTNKAVLSKQRRIFIHNCLRGSEGYHWDYQPVFDAKTQYVRGANKPSFC